MKYLSKKALLINWGNANNTFKKFPPHYPEKCYFLNKIHIAPLPGREWHILIRDKH